MRVFPTMARKSILKYDTDEEHCTCSIDVWRVQTLTFSFIHFFLMFYPSSQWKTFAV